MDLLFKRYASPFLLLERYIRAGRFSEFVNEFMSIQNEEMIWEVWLHRVFDMTFDEFKKAIVSASINSIKPTKKQIETTLQTSKNILDSFIPE